MEENTYLLLLERVYNENISAQQYYYPHRKEEVEKLKRIEAIGYKIVRLNEPFENYFKTQTKCASIISTFYCSGVLDNISISNKNLPELRIYKFNSNLIKRERYIYDAIHQHMLQNKELIFSI